MSHEAIRIIECGSVEEYARACTDDRRVVTDIPLICSNDRTWPVAALLNGNNPIKGRSDAMVIASDGLASLPARVLARSLDVRLEIYPVKELRVRTHEATRDAPVMLTVLREEADDALLFGLLDDFQQALETPCWWEELPQVSLVTARDIAGLSWVVAKLVVRACTGNQPAVRRFVAVLPEGNSSVVKELHSGHDPARFTVREADAEKAAEAFLTPAHVLAFSTHGEDACASGGGGVVLCGLHALPSGRLAEAPSVSATADHMSVADHVVDAENRSDLLPAHASRVTSTDQINDTGSMNAAIHASGAKQNTRISAAGKMQDLPKSERPIDLPANRAEHIVVASVASGTRHRHNVDHASTGGMLSCGLGHPCLRGPRPVRLSAIPAQTLMLHACNSIRLADGALAPEFNLGLEFLDGMGHAYVGSLYTGGGSMAASAFMAAMASGATFGESINFSNALITLSGLERSMFHGIGLVNDVAEPRNSIPAPQGVNAQMGNTDVVNGQLSPSVKVAARSSHLVSVVLDDKRIVECAKTRRLSFGVESMPADDSVYWFYRIERGRKAGSPPIVRAFFFRFPEPLQELAITPLDGISLRDQCTRALKSLERWIEVWRLGELAESHADAYKELLQTHTRARDLFASHLARIKFEGRAPRVLAQYRDAVLNRARDAGETALQAFAPRLKGSFWLTSVLAAEYRFDGADRAPCAYCAGLVVRKWMKHPIHGERRTVDVCPHCGIVADLPEPNADEAAIALSGIVIDAPDHVRAGAVLEGSVKLSAAQADALDKRVTVYVRLCTHNHRDVPPMQEQTQTQLTAAHAELPFKFAIPHDIPPHQYRIKVLASTSGCVAFASRLLYVVN